MKLVSKKPRFYAVLLFMLVFLLSLDSVPAPAGQAGSGKARVKAPALEWGLISAIYTYRGGVKTGCVILTSFKVGGGSGQISVNAVVRGKNGRQVFKKVKSLTVKEGKTYRVSINAGLDNLTVGPARGCDLIISSPSGTGGAIIEFDKSLSTLGDIEIRQDMSNSDLSGLTVSPGNLSPAFSPGVTDYKVNTSNRTSSINVTAKTEDPDAFLTINGQNQVSGMPRTINLAAGDNKVYIKVYSPDKSTNSSYTININRSSSSIQKKWEFKTGGSIDVPVIGPDGTIYAGVSGASKLFAINKNGTRKWVFTAGGYVTPPVLGSDGAIYAGSGDGNLYAFDKTGKKKWQCSVGGQVRSLHLGSGDVIYAASINKKLFAVSKNGVKKWDFAAGDWISATALGSNNVVYIGAGTKIFAVNPDGSSKWQFEAENSVNSLATGADGAVFAGVAGNKLYAVNPDGTQKWEFEAGGNVNTPVMSKDGTVYVGARDNRLYAISPGGIKKWEFVTGGCIYFDPAIGPKGLIYVGSGDNKLYCVNPDGSKRWEFLTGGRVNSPAVASDGTVYVGSGDNKLYAVGQQ